MPSRSRDISSKKISKVATPGLDLRNNVFNVATFSQSHDITSTMSRHRAKSLKNYFQSHDICPNSRVSSLLKRTCTRKFQIQTKFLKHLSPNSFQSFIFETLEAMSSPSSPTLDEVIKKIMEDV